MKNVSSLVLSVLSLLSFLPVTTHGQTQPMAEYWADTGVRFSSLRNTINDEVCNENAATFWACFKAINTLAVEIGAGQFTPSSPGDTFASPNNGHYSLAPVTSEAPFAQGLGPAARLAAIRQRGTAEQNEAQDNFRSFGRQTFSFDMALSALLAQATHVPNEAAIAALTLNVQIQALTDPHSRLSPITMDNELVSSNSTSYQGVGIAIEVTEAGIVAGNVAPNGPAYLAGVRAGDLITKINQTETQGLSPAQVVRLLLGPAHTNVRLRLLRAGLPRLITVTRGSILNPNVSSETYTMNGRRIGYIKLDTFMSTAGCREIGVRLALLSEEVQSLILDLRGNPGGLTAQASCISGFFLGRGRLVFTTRYLDRNVVIESLATEDRITQLPLLVLIDGGSASASEIVAGALQDHQRAWIAGQRSYGKGTVQGPFTTSITGVQMWRTIARFHLPSGRTNQIVGIQPDFIIDPVANATEEDRFYYREESLYTNALPPLGEPWQQTRGEQIAHIQKRCAGHEARVTAALERENRGATRPDYMLWNAIDLASCLR